MSTQNSISKEYQAALFESEEFINSVIKKKYCIYDNENTYDDVLKRINQNIEDKFTNVYDYHRISSMLTDKRFIPAGSILYGIGNNSKCSMSNCYFIPITQDSIDGIFETAREMSLTYASRGGAGICATVMRPKNCPVSNSAKYSSGSVSFLPMYSNITHTIGQNGRRAALMISMDVRHPDILDFIWCKSKPDSVFPKDFLSTHTPDVSGANISVKLTNEFMEAVKADKNWTFIFPDTKFEKYDTEWDGDYDGWISKGYPIKEYNTVKAKDVLKQISESAWLSGDPGVLFWDRVVNYSSTKFDSKLIPRGTNPCGF